MKTFQLWLVVGGCLISLLAPAPRNAVGADAKPTIKEIMQTAHKKPKELLKKVATGAATDAEKAELVKLYQALAALRPARGDTASWEEKTKSLLSAARAAAEGKPDAAAELNRVANCAACHKAHQ